MSGKWFLELHFRAGPGGRRKDGGKAQIKEFRKERRRNPQMEK